MSEHLERVEKSADRIRGELLETLRELDRRRHQATNVRHQVAQHLGLLIGVGAAALAFALAGIAVGRVRTKTRHSRRARDRVRGFIRAWDHPQQIANQRPGRPLPEELARKAAMIVATTFITQLARRSAQRALPAK